MRWNGLFADLEAQAHELEVAERSAEVEERTRLETAQIGLVQRLVPAVGQVVQIRCDGAVTISGRLLEVRPEWVLVDEGSGREALAAMARIRTVSGLGRFSAQAPSELDARLGSLRQVLRVLARDRSNIRIHLAEGTVLDGTIDRVGRDFVELAVHAPGEVRRRAEVRGMVVVAMSGVVAVRRAV